MNAVSLSYADVNGVRIRYLDKGNGPLLLLIHGLGATHADWQKQIDFFARVFRVIAPDLRGHGDSQGQGPFNIDRLATDLSLLLDHLQIGPLFVMGHSMGGAVAMQLALFKPERVKKLVLADTLPSFVPNTWHKHLLLWTRRIALRLYGTEVMARRMAQQQFPKPEQESLREMMVVHSLLTTKSVYLALLKALSKWTVADRLNWFVMPVFVVAGDNDYFPPEEAQLFADSLPDGRCRIVEGANHYLPLDKPEDFNRITMEFLMPGSAIAAGKGEAALNWLRIDTAAQQKIDLQTLIKPK